jgi:hypothetical protein
MGRQSIQPSSPGDWIPHFQPRAIIATHASFPRSEMIPEHWLSFADAAGVAFFHQGQTGMVSIAIKSDGSLELTSFLNQQRLIIPRP